MEQQYRLKSRRNIKMAFGVADTCFTCKYLNWDERDGEKVYCEWIKGYIKPDTDGCGHHDEKK